MASTSKPLRMIIDTDPGIDDAMAILFALAHPDIELLGLTTIHGNVPVELATANALRIVELGGKPLPVCEGSASAIAGAPTSYPTSIHGKDGLGETNLAESSTKKDPRSALEFMSDTVSANPGEVTLVPVGPLTNIAQFAAEHHELVPLVKEVVLMGGAAFHPGNATPMAEANTYGDPEAADIVFGTGWPVTMVGLNVTHSTVVSEKEFEAIAKSNKSWGEFLGKISAFYLDFYKRNRGFAGCCMHDVCAVALPIARELFTIEHGAIRAACDGFMRGNTAIMPEDFSSDDQLWSERPVQSYAADIDSEAMRKLFVDTLATYSS